MGQPVAGVVTVTSVDGRQVARTKADGTVGYTVSDLRPGTYMLIVTAPGFPGPFSAIRDQPPGHIRVLSLAASPEMPQVPMGFSLAGCEFIGRARPGRHHGWRP